jgi:hypothetical protein
MADIVKFRPATAADDAPSQQRVCDLFAQMVKLVDEMAQPGGMTQAREAEYRRVRGALRGEDARVQAEIQMEAQQPWLMT